MFNAFNWFEKPELFTSTRNAVLEWAGADERQVYQLSQTDGSTLKPETRILNSRELAALKRNADRAWQGKSFGGFITGKSLTDLKGICLFDLNSEKTEAKLTGLVLDKTLSEFQPLQNAVLLLALIGLLNEVSTLEEITLPFGEVSEQDLLSLRMLKLGFDEKAGSWLTNQKFSRKTNFLTYALDLVSPVWQEVKLKVEPGLYTLALHYYLRFSFAEKIQVQFLTTSGPLGEDVVDNTAPITIQSYVPLNDRHENNLNGLVDSLKSLFLLNPNLHLDMKWTALEEVKINEIKTDHSSEVYRIGRNIVIKIKLEDTDAPEFTSLPDDLVINLAATTDAFGPQKGYIHPTSQVALELLEKWLDPEQHRNVLDLGTGSGALAIAAGRLGVKQILAIDPNHEAIEFARKNIGLNSLEDQITVEAGSLGLKDSEDETLKYRFDEELQKRPPSLDKSLPFDAILANLFTRNLITMSGAISESLKPGGLLISCGIPTKDIDEVLAAYAAVGLEPVATQEFYGWNGFVSRKL